MSKITKLIVVLSVPAVLAGCAASAKMESGGFDGAKSLASFTSAFNSRDWDGVKGQLADDVVFHRASGDQVYIGPDAVIARFKNTIGAPDQWNVKFAKLNSTSQFTGTKGGVVVRGDFAVTAGGDDSSCYAGSHMSTWAQSSDTWKLKLLAWQDVQTDLANCK